VFLFIFLAKKKVLSGLSREFCEPDRLSFSGSFCPGFSLFHHYLCRSRAIFMGAMIHIQCLFRWLGMRIVPWGQQRFFLRMMSGVRMGVVQGMVFVLFHVPILIKACR
jgi:hypothetical protein